MIKRVAVFLLMFLPTVMFSLQGNEATFVFSVSVESNFSIGINSHNILDDFDLLLYNHTSNELITSTSESYSGYSNIEGMLNTRDTYRLKIIGSKHEKDRAGKFYINQKSTQS